MLIAIPGRAADPNQCNKDEAVGIWITSFMWIVIPLGSHQYNRENLGR